MIGSLELLYYYVIPGFENMGLLVNILKMFWRWWEVHDVSNSTQHVYERIKDKTPFYTKDDKRLQKQQEKFPFWLRK